MKGSMFAEVVVPVDSYDAANAYIDFYENKHKYVRKSIYQRKYRLKTSSIGLGGSRPFI